MTTEVKNRSMALAASLLVAASMAAGGAHAQALDSTQQGRLNKGMNRADASSNLSQSDKAKAAQLAAKIEAAVLALGEHATAEQEQAAIVSVIDGAGVTPQEAALALAGLSASGEFTGGAAAALGSVATQVAVQVSNTPNPSAGTTVSGLNGSAAISNAPGATSGGGSDYKPG